MYIAELKLWNFRRYGKSDWDLNKPHLIVPFQKGLNVLIGENDSGKTAILDAIKLVLKTHAYEWIRVEESDFHLHSNKMRIEIIIKDLNTEEASNFTEWLSWQEDGTEAKPILRLIYEAERKANKILSAEVKAGVDDVGHSLGAEAKEYLKATYLKALRDADGELVAKKNSRLSQILLGHDLFKINDGTEHQFEVLFKGINNEIKEWFDDDAHPQEGITSNREQIKGVIDKFLQDFIGDSYNSKLQLTDPDIKAILEKISIGLDGVDNLGLGTMNRLYMATELLHLKKEWNGLKLCLIEELEAHLHPQSQMKVIETLLNEHDVQFILTTHSPNLASKVDVDKLIICNDGDVFPLTKGSTHLKDQDYLYLQQFLDVTKSNLFFAKGVIIVEGWAEEILLPIIAKQLGCDLTKYEVSIINVGSTAYLNFAKIFLRKDQKTMNIPVSIVTDLDIRPNEHGGFDGAAEETKMQSIQHNLDIETANNIKLFIAKHWTLEWCLFKSALVGNLFKKSVSIVHSRTIEFQELPSNQFKIEFEDKLIKKLKKQEGTSKLDKVAIAHNLSELLKQYNTDLKDKNDEYIDYLFDAIKHACRVSS